MCQTPQTDKTKKQAELSIVSVRLNCDYESVCFCLSFRWSLTLNSKVAYLFMVKAQSTGYMQKTRPLIKAS